MRLHIVLDLPNIDASQVDPHTLADDLLRDEFDTFGAGNHLLPNNKVPYHLQHTTSLDAPEDFLDATYVSAEWEESDTLVISPAQLRHVLNLAADNVSRGNHTAKEAAAFHELRKALA